MVTRILLDKLGRRGLRNNRGDEARFAIAIKKAMLADSSTIELPISPKRLAAAGIDLPDNSSQLIFRGLPHSSTSGNID
jgi:hypothetical protein